MKSLTSDVVSSLNKVSHSHSHSRLKDNTVNSLLTDTSIRRTSGVSPCRTLFQSLHCN